jgi:hypothetical protein
MKPSDQKDVLQNSTNQSQSSTKVQATAITDACVDTTETSNLKPKRAAKKVIAKPKDATVISVPNNTENLLDDVKLIIAADLAKYRAKAIAGIPLDQKEARIIQGYASELTKLQKEERDQARADDLSKLSDEELLQLASQLFGNTQPKLIE